MAIYIGGRNEICVKYIYDYGCVAGKTWQDEVFKRNFRMGNEW